MKGSLARTFGDRRRRQQGSVLSGVLIITAFVAILSGALMTELSSSFILSHTFAQRVANEATIDSALELGLSQLQSQPVNQGCPVLSPVSLNGLVAASAYQSCGPSVDTHVAPFTAIAAAEPFTIDGVTASVPPPGGNEYIVVDSLGHFFRYGFGQTTASWTASIGGSVTAPPLAFPNGTTVLVPVQNPTAPGSPGCGAMAGCVASLDYGQGVECYMQAGGVVPTSPAAGVRFPNTVYFADSSGTLWAYDVSSDTCSALASVSVPQAVVAGPIVFPGKTADEIFMVLSDGSGSQLIQFEYRGPRKLRDIYAKQLALPQAVGLQFDQSQLPARAAITFANGLVQLLQVQSGNAGVIGQYSLPTSLATDPTWCCGASPSTIGVGGQNGRFYVLDSTPALIANYSLGAAINTAATTDSAGDWFVGADDGNLHEIPAVQSNPTSYSFGNGGMGLIRSAANVGSCGAGLCAYLGAASGSLFMVHLTVWQATMWACLGASASACSGANPRGWTSVQVGSVASATPVYIQGWSYYSP